MLLSVCLPEVLGVPGNSIKCRYVFSSVGEEKIIATLSEGKASGSFFAYTQTGYTNETLWFVVYSDDIKVFCLAGGNPNANCELLISNKSIIMKNKITGGIPLSYFNVSNFTINNVYE